MRSHIKSPDSRYEVVKRDYGEVAMGSPQFGQIEIRGARFDTRGQAFGEAIEFSPDSRFLAVEQLVAIVPHPHTRVVVFDFKRQRQIIVHVQNPGFIRRFTWSRKGLLTFIIWSLAAGEQERSWQSPPAPPPTFFANFFG